MNPQDYFTTEASDHLDLQRQRSVSLVAKAQDLKQSEKLLEIKHAQADLRFQEVEILRERIMVDAERKQLETQQLIVNLYYKLLQQEEKRIRQLNDLGVLRAQNEQMRVMIKMVTMEKRLASAEMVLREKALEIERADIEATAKLKEAQLVTQGNRIHEMILQDRNDRMQHMQEVRDREFNTQVLHKDQQLRHREHSLAMGQRENDLTLREGMMKLEGKKQQLQDIYLQTRTEREKQEVAKAYSSLVLQEAQLVKRDTEFETERRRVGLESALSALRGDLAQQREIVTDRLNQSRNADFSAQSRSLLSSLESRESQLELRSLSQNIAHERAMLETQNVKKDFQNRESHLELRSLSQKVAHERALLGAENKNRDYQNKLSATQAERISVQNELTAKENEKLRLVGQYNTLVNKLH